VCSALLKARTDCLLIGYFLIQVGKEVVPINVTELLVFIAATVISLNNLFSGQDTALLILREEYSLTSRSRLISLGLELI
jgi:hypothetical protein